MAEELIFGEDAVTSGASSDLSAATNIARAMVERYGLSKEIGLMYFDDNNPPTGKKKGEIDEEVKKVLQAAYERAKHVLSTHEKELHRLAQALLIHETLDLEQIKTVIAGKEITVELSDGTEIKNAKPKRGGSLDLTKAKEKEGKANVMKKIE